MELDELIGTGIEENRTLTLQYCSYPNNLMFELEGHSVLLTTD